FFFLRSSAAHRDLYSFPTRRSSDLEEALYDSLAMRQFVGIDLGREPAPDETTILRFRHLLESHDLGRQLFAAVSAHLQAQGLKRSEEHTSELQSLAYLVCRLLLEKK